MKTFIALFLFLNLTFTAMGQTENPEFDKELAESLGADDYGMKSYVLVILKTGPTVIEDRDTLNQIFRGHLDNITRLADLGDLVIAGPLGQNEKTYRGIFILNVKTIEEAEELLQTDPAISSKVLDAEIYTWYGSAALPVYLDAARKVGKFKP